MTNLDLHGYYNFRANRHLGARLRHRQRQELLLLPQPGDRQVAGGQLGPRPDLDHDLRRRRHHGPLSDDVLAIPEFQLDYRNQVRHLRDLLHNSEQQGMLLDEIAHWVYTPGQNSMVDADRAMWDYNPILTSSYVNSSKAGHGRYYEAATTPTRSFAGMVAKLKSYAAGRVGFMTSTYLNADESSIPTKPTISYSGAAGFPTNDLDFTSSSFNGSGGATFAAQQWRIAEVTLPGDPRFDPSDPLYDRYAERLYEIDAAWESGDITTTGYAATIPPIAVRPDRLYRVRTKMMDSAGRWSHWSAPIEFTTSQPDLSEYIDSLRITEFMYHPPEATGAETIVSTDQDDYEFIELKNVGSQPARSAQCALHQGGRF